MPAESNKVVVIALVANIGVALTKFVAAFATGSSAMFSEGVHSLIDTADEGLLLFGIRRSKRPPDEAHPLGHAHEVYFWSFVVAVLIFGLGGGVTIYEGIAHLNHPRAPTEPVWNYATLGFAAIFEGASLRVGYRQFRSRMGDSSLIHAIRISKDPTLFTIVIEDTAALMGIAVAFLGVFLTQFSGNARFDAAASIVIGLILAAVAVLIGYEVRGLLIGESADPAMVRKIRMLAEQDPAVERANPPVTMQLGPQTVLVALELQFVPKATSGEVAAAIERIESAIRRDFTVVSQIYIEAKSIGRGGHERGGHENEPMALPSAHARRSPN